MEANARGIPKSPFVQDVEQFVGTTGGIEASLNSMQELLRKYQFMQSSTVTRQSNIKVQMQELSETLQVIALRQQAESASDFDFELDETLYVKAQADATAPLCLWLGANTMLMYELEEAQQLLESKRTSAQRQLVAAGEDLAWLQEQITVTQINIARMYNWDVRRRRTERHSLP